MNNQERIITLTNENGISYKIAEQHKDHHTFIRNHIINTKRTETIYKVDDKVYCLDWSKRQFN